MLKLFNRIFFGGSFKVAHIDAATGKRKVFWCDTWADAIEWVSCALNEDTVTVTNTMGFVLAVRSR